MPKYPHTPDLALTPWQVILIHELGHVWQYQKGEWYRTKAAWEWVSTLGRPYKYNLSECENFEDYGVEQQGKILEDYYLEKAIGHEVGAYEKLLKKVFPLKQ